MPASTTTAKKTLGRPSKPRAPRTNYQPYSAVLFSAAQISSSFR